MSRLFASVSTLALFACYGCELVADFDRDKIPPPQVQIPSIPEDAGSRRDAGSAGEMDSGVDGGLLDGGLLDDATPGEAGASEGGVGEGGANDAATDAAVDGGADAEADDAAVDGATPEDDG